MNQNISSHILAIALLIVIVLPSTTSGLESDPALVIQDADAQLEAQLLTTVPLSRQMVDDAIHVLSAGWSDMNRAEREEFLRFYDPAHTGAVDEAYVQAVLDNYLLIRKALNRQIVIRYATGSNACFGQQLYYTDFFRVYVCPYYVTESNPERKARTFIHEIAHKALFALDRPYYRPTNKRYAELTPEGPWTSQLPFIGPLIREVVRGDTLYHPDAYAHFALVMHNEI